MVIRNPEIQENISYNFQQLNTKKIIQLKLHPISIFKFATFTKIINSIAN
jgi:hypothetical protein